MGSAESFNRKSFKVLGPVVQPVFQPRAKLFSYFQYSHSPPIHENNFIAISLRLFMHGDQLSVIY